MAPPCEEGGVAELRALLDSRFAYFRRDGESFFDAARVTSQGPIGPQPSPALPSIHWLERDCRSRTEKSWPQA